MRGERPSPAIIIAMLALVVALGGTAVAASRYVITNSSQIKPSVLSELRAGPTAHAAKVPYKATIKHYANRITLPPTAHEEREGSGALLMEVPNVAKLTLRQCGSDARVEVTSLNTTTSRALSAPVSNTFTYAEFRSADANTYQVQQVEGSGWKPFVIVPDQGTTAEVPNKIATFRVEGGAGAATTIATFTVVATSPNTEAESECTFSMTADVYRG